MEKRTLLAFALSFLVLFLWETYFGAGRAPQTQAPSQSQETAPSSEPAAPSQSAPTAAPASGAPETLPASQSADLDQNHVAWTVNTPLYTMQLHESGGRIQGLELKAYKQGVAADAPQMELISTRTLGYLPLAVDSIKHPEWQLSTRQFSTQDPANLVVAEGSPQKTFSMTTLAPDQVRLTKVFTFSPDSYAIDLTIKLENLSGKPLADQLGVSWYYQPFDVHAGSYNQSSLAVLAQGSPSRRTIKEIQKDKPTFQPPYQWVGYENNYFLNAFVPQDAMPGEVVPKVLKADAELIQTVYLTEPFEIEANQSKTITMRLYMGPKELGWLRQAGSNLVAAVDFGWFGFVARPLLDVLKWLYTYLHNYGTAIIVLTIVIKLIFWPLTHKSYKSMQMMKKLQPKINQVREKYKDDREKLNQELMLLYRAYKVNPLGGCLPMVLQIPVFFALYRMLANSVELLHQPFALWIHDLTAPDRLYVGFDIPYLGGIPVMTILMGASMFIQQKMTPSAGDPTQEKIMLLMPVMFTFFFINFPSGLVLYWLVNNVLSIAQQYWINRSA
ncbi:MAG: membrane protein insertase YidC [Syntrophobacteraceae bacterium]